jgi:phosphoglycolate phosphatase
MKKAPPGILAVVFDFDGTLALLNIDFQEMRRDVLDLAESYGIPKNDLGQLFVLETIAEVRRRIGPESAGRDVSFSMRAMGLVADRERTGAANSLLFPGVKEMFGVLRGRGIRTGILTRNCLDAVKVIFPDVHSYCDAVVTREDTPRVKPDPEHIRVLLARLNVDPSLCAMVGDHPMDIAVAKKVGAFAVGVLTGYSSADELKGAGAEMILEEVAEITKYLE